MNATLIASECEARTQPRVVVAGLASCFGCQLQITNAEAHLLEVLGQIDLRYWQLVSSEPLPDEYDVAVIEGAVTTDEAVRTVRELRAKAKAVIAVGACAVTGGVPGMAGVGFDDRVAGTFAGEVPSACGAMRAPKPVSDYIDVDFQVRCCPIDSYDFIRVLQSALYGSNHVEADRTMCGDCKRRENECFYKRGTLCLGLVTRAACGARCVNLGRPCNGCAGLSPDANLEAARATCTAAGVDPRRFDEALQMFNQAALIAAADEARKEAD